jgi:hypothetical protein
MMRAGAKRKKDPGKQHPEASDSEEEEMVRVLEVQEEVVDYEDNLTYHEDSLSVIKGFLVRSPSLHCGIRVSVLPHRGQPQC